MRHTKNKIKLDKYSGKWATLLGRDNFFLPFLVTFNEKEQKVLLEEHNQ